MRNNRCQRKDPRAFPLSVRETDTDSNSPAPAAVLEQELRPGLQREDRQEPWQRPLPPTPEAAGCSARRAEASSCPVDTDLPGEA